MKKIFALILATLLIFGGVSTAAPAFADSDNSSTGQYTPKLLTPLTPGIDCATRGFINVGGKAVDPSKGVYYWWDMDSDPTHWKAYAKPTDDRDNLVDPSSHQPTKKVMWTLDVNVLCPPAPSPKPAETKVNVFGDYERCEFSQCTCDELEKVRVEFNEPDYRPYLEANCGTPVTPRTQPTLAPLTITSEKAMNLEVTSSGIKPIVETPLANDPEDDTNWAVVAGVFILTGLLLFVSALRGRKRSH